MFDFLRQVEIARWNSFGLDNTGCFQKSTNRPKELGTSKLVRKLLSPVQPQIMKKKKYMPYCSQNFYLIFCQNLKKYIFPFSLKIWQNYSNDGEGTQMLRKKYSQEFNLSLRSLYFLYLRSRTTLVLQPKNPIFPQIVRLY